MKTRRDFLKLSLTVLIGATVVTPELTRAVAHLEQYHPEVQAVFERLPDDLLSHEKKAIAQFILAEIECGNWGLYDSMFQFFPSSESNSLTKWIK